MGLTRMADSCGAVSLHQLTWTADWHIRDDCYRQGRVALVDYLHRLAFARHWGDGNTSSSDGQFFRTGGAGSAAGSINLHYSNDPGVKFYAHVSGLYGPFHVAAISPNVSEAPYVLDGLLYHESSLVIREHYTDTGGVSDHVFGLCPLLGFRFAPRIRDLKDRRLYTFGKTSRWTDLEKLFGGELNVRAVRSQWDEVLRLATSLKTGTVPASTMLRKLASCPRQNGLAVALRELGRLERTLYMLDWFLDPALRRRSLGGLNKGEAKHSLDRAVYFNRLWETRDRTLEKQRYRASGLNLVVAAIIVWNTRYLERAVAQLRAEGHMIPDEQLAHLSTLGWEHIALTGDYSWEGHFPTDPPAFRPLRDLPASAVA
jgi:TnpA family transposase